jgi:hypothetical protein
MKAQVKQLAAYYGCQCSYSGNKRIMYIHGDNNKEAIVAIKSQLKPEFQLIED